MLTHSGLRFVAAGFLHEVIGFRGTLLIAAAMVILPAFAVLMVRYGRVMSESH